MEYGILKDNLIVERVFDISYLHKKNIFYRLQDHYIHTVSYSHVQTLWVLRFFKFNRSRMTPGNPGDGEAREAREASCGTQP